MNKEQVIDWLIFYKILDTRYCSVTLFGDDTFVNLYINTAIPS